MKVESVEDLEVFKKSHRLTIKVYKITERFPKSELFGLVSQMRRASASIATNLMEGSHRLNRAEYRQFVGIAKGSVGELKYHFLLARDLEYLSEKEYLAMRSEADEISRMLSGLVKSLSPK
ncbi:MAG: four helix bundle protein [Proteobacteria bacterium]|nr:four helix bundle protein [Pseudomonadota bacterium]